MNIFIFFGDIFGQGFVIYEEAKTIKYLYSNNRGRIVAASERNDFSSNKSFLRLWSKFRDFYKKFRNISSTNN